MSNVEHPQIRVENDDDDFVAPVAATVEDGEALPLKCPNCGKPTKGHTAGALMRCLDALDGIVDEDRPPARRVGVEPKARYEPPQTTRVIPPQPPKERRVVEPPPPPPAPPEPPPARNELPTIELASPAPPPLVEQQQQQERSFAELPQKILITEQGEIDYVELAKAMRKVIEDERDEMIRRGGPIEKQNIELKERLASALEEAGRWRSKFQRKCEEYNLLEEQYRELVATNRKLRNVAKNQRGVGNPTKVVELKDILKVVEHTKGFTVERAGNGHYLIKKDGIFVTDAASSGQGNKVNMATRVALRKAGVDV